MGKRGPRPTPTPILQMRGSPLAKRATTEPRPVYGPPGKPGWLSPEAGEAWDQVVPVLMSMRVLSVADEFALARYVSTWVQWRKAQAFVDRHGTSYGLKDGNGRVKCFAPFPEVGMLSRLSVALSRMEAEFGLTPSARTRINVPVQPREPSEVDLRYFGGPASAL